MPVTEPTNTKDRPIENRPAKKTLTEKKREDIVAAARAAFQEFGVQATSMDKLAQLAGVSKRTVYNHFPQKEALVAHLFTELWEKALVQQDIPYQSGQPLAEQLTLIVRAEVHMLSDPEWLNLARVALGHYFFHPEELKREVEKMTCQETILHRWLKAALEDKQLKLLDVEFAADQIHNLIKGSCFWPQLLRVEEILEPEAQEHVIERTVSMFLSEYQAS